MKPRFAVCLLTTLLIFTISGSFQGVYADTEATAPEKSSEPVDTKINQEVTKSIKSVEVGKQIQIVSDVNNNQDRNQPFAYIVQIKDEYGVVISLGWLTGELTPGQFLSPALSWIPENTGVYTATIFVWEGIDNPVALSHPLEITLEVHESEKTT